jgi:mannose-6-phosphate isomerase-like protein (cupin superfamily)
MSSIQVFRLEDAIAPQRSAGGSHRGRGLNGKDGGGLELRRFPIDTGLPGLNISLTFGSINDGFYSPRHHHNFDQFRYVISGSVNIGKNLDLQAGECGYFPEGTYYGPQEQVGVGKTLVLQFPGPNGAYYMQGQELRAATEALRARGGVFENGVYRGVKPDGSPDNKDGFEAVWEEHNQAPVVYSAERYTQPVIMRPEAFRWIPAPHRNGLQKKNLGSFSEYQTSVALWSLAPGAGIPSEVLDAPQIRFVLSGEVIYDGKELSQYSCLYIPEGLATQHLETRQGAELLVITLPMYVAEVWHQVHSAVAVAT